MPVWYFTKPEIPRRGAALAFSALIVPVVNTLMVTPSDSGAELLLWLVALVPGFLLAHYRGWRGAATALAVGMAVLALTQAALLLFGRPTPNPALLFGVTVVYLAGSLVVGWSAEALHEHRSKAELLALTDDLTKVPNRRRARMFLDREFEAATIGQPLSVVMFDIDAFKVYNDTFGHAAGDQALKDFSHALLSATRLKNLSARYGGEEFLTVLPKCDAEAALSFVDRVRTALRAAQPADASLTVSAGIASYQGAMSSPNELLGAADQALYAAKKQGRDAVQVFGRPVSASFSSSRA
jgi:diguanylate cyclase (GGDEF)-like protein